MRPIVVPVNFAANAANAARYAADIALNIGADLHLIYVFQIPTSIGEVPMPESVFDEMRDSGQELLDDLKTALSKKQQAGSGSPRIWRSAASKQRSKPSANS